LDSTVSASLLVWGDAVASWPRNGVILLILLALALGGTAVLAGARGAASTAAYEPLDAPASTPPSHAPAIPDPQPPEGDGDSQNRQPYDSATGNPIDGDLTSGEREPFDV
jgi:hypothetical protein